MSNVHMMYESLVMSNAVNGAAQDEDSDREAKKVILFAVWC